MSNNYLRIKDGAKYRKTVDMPKRIQLLRDIKQLLEDNGIVFYPISGTLLNFVRTKEVVPYDPDIDFGVWYYDYNKIVGLKQDIEKLGYKILIKGAYMSICFAEDYWNESECSFFIHKYDKDWYYRGTHFHISIEFLMRDGDNMFVFEFFDENIFNKLFGRFKKVLINNPNKDLSIKTYNFFNGLFNSVILFMRRHYVFPYSWFKDTVTIKIYDMVFKIPSGYKKILEHKYGKTWRVPIATNRNLDKSINRSRKNSKNKYFVKDKKIRSIWIKRGNVCNVENPSWFYYLSFRDFFSCIIGSFFVPVHFLFKLGSAICCFRKCGCVYESWDEL